MSELQFYCADFYTHDDKAILDGTVSKAIVQPVETFLSNIRRLKSLHEIPADFGSMYLGIAIALFNSTMFKAKHLPGESKDDATERMFRELMNDRKPRDYAEIEKDLVKMIARTGRLLVPGLEAILHAQVTGTWTAFEVLAGDLWETALNAHPLSFANLTADSGDSVSREEQQQTRSLDETFGLQS